MTPIMRIAAIEPTKNSTCCGVNTCQFGWSLMGWHIFKGILPPFLLDAVPSTICCTQHLDSHYGLYKQVFPLRMFLASGDGLWSCYVGVVVLLSAPDTMVLMSPEVYSRLPPGSQFPKLTLSEQGGLLAELLNTRRLRTAKVINGKWAFIFS